MDILSFMLGKAAGGGGGGGGDITVEQLNVSSNNTYTAPSGKAYSPVVVNVPNSYSAGDEGKVVSNGALVAQTSDTVTQNGTVDTTLINSLLVNVSGGGGGLEYEEGTWTPSENTSTANISFANQHTKLPIFAMLVDAVGDNDNTFNTNYYWSVFNIVGLTNKTIPATEAGAKGIYCRSYRTNNANQAVTNGASLSSDDSTSKYSLDYYLRTNGFTADNNLTGSLPVVWRSGRTYKWIAVWAPTE